MRKSITVTVCNTEFKCDPNNIVNRSSTVTFRLAENRSSAVVELLDNGFTESSITLCRDCTPPIVSKQVTIQPNASNGTYRFSTTQGTILEASKSKSKGKGEDPIEPLIGDVEVVPDGEKDVKGHGKRVASVTEAEQGLTAG